MSPARGVAERPCLDAEAARGSARQRKVAHLDVNVRVGKEAAEEIEQSAEAAQIPEVGCNLFQRWGVRATAQHQPESTR